MRKLKLNFFSRTSELYIEQGLLGHICEYVRMVGPPPVVLLCTDSNVGPLYGRGAMESLAADGLHAELITFPAGESSKSLSTLDAIYEAAGRCRMGRDGLILALGGGVVSDVSGFAAATWMRGVRWVVGPTTLEADVDACLGGKTAINHATGKNMVGAFHQPELILVDPLCLRTLPMRDVRAGLAESVKHALIREAEFLDWHEAKREAILALDGEVMAELVERNLRIKAGVVEADERESGVRAILNFGHTVGHAFESWFQYELRHGEAVALGMVAAARISERLGRLAGAAVERIVAVLEGFGLPVVAPRPFDLNAVLELTHGDKKVQSGRRRWVLLDGVGAASIHDNVDDGVVREVLVLLQPA